MKVVKTKRKSPKPWWLKALNIIAIIVLVILLFNIVLSFIATKKARSLIEKNAMNLTVDFDYIRVNIIARSIRVNDLCVVPDTNVVDFRIEVENCNINGIGIAGALSGGMAVIQKIHIDKALVKGNIQYLLDYKPGEQADSADSSDEEFSARIKEFILRDFKADSLVMPDIIPFQDISSLNISINDLKLSTHDSTPLYSVEDIIIDAGKSRISLPGEFYDLEFYSFHTKFSDSILKADSLRLIPKYGFYEFGRMKGLQTDRFAVGVDKFEFNGLDAYRALEGNGLFAKHLLVEKLYLKIFRDKRIPFDYNNFPPLPQQALNRLSFPVLIDESDFNNMYVEYAEQNEVSDKPGTVSFSNLQIHAENMANRRSKTVKDNFILKGNGLLYGSTEVNAEFIFPVYTKNDTFFFNGVAEEMDIKKANAILTPLTDIQILGGQLQQAVYRGSANDKYSIGSFKMLYKDLSFQILKGKGKTYPKKSKGLLSFFARTVVRSNNPIGKKSPKEVEMSFMRDVNKGFINFYWKTILNGIKNTVLPGKRNKVRKEILK